MNVGISLVKGNFLVCCGVNWFAGAFLKTDK